MTETISQKDILFELQAIKKDLAYIKNHMVDVDSMLIGGEETRLNESLEEHGKRKTSSINDFEKEMNC